MTLEHPQTAKVLLDKFGEGEWQDSWLYWYGSVKDFTLHELEDGWYFDYKLKHEVDFDGAVELLDFIDYKALGKALVKAWDEDRIFVNDNGEVVVTKVGW